MVTRVSKASDPSGLRGVMNLQAVTSNSSSLGSTLTGDGNCEKDIPAIDRGSCRKAHTVSHDGDSMPSWLYASCRLSNNERVQMTVTVISVTLRRSDKLHSPWPAQ